MKKSFSYILVLLLIVSCKEKSDGKKHSATSGATKIVNLTHYPQERHLANVKQLTFGGDNAEAYWSFDSKKLTFQANSKQWGLKCDQIFTMNITDDLSQGQIPQMVSTGNGRTTCSYFLPGDATIIYSSTHLADINCPPTPKKEDYGNKYIWPVYKGFDIFIADTKGNQLKQLTFEDGYDAEPTVSPKGDKIVFTSTRTGDLELFTMNIDGTDVRQVTDELGYDGGAFFSPDGTKLIFRSSRPKTPEDIKEYKDLLAEGLVQPTHMELYTCNIDGSEMQKITDLGSANWAPFFHPSGKKVIFSSNHKTKMSFNLFMINVDGTGLEQITYDTVFDAFPMFSPDGKKIVFSSNRNNNGTHDTNLFVADWVE
ncbi:MAG: PD40 domain-containing protein [Flavobacteriales bacterium]|jgi:TolB protein|nr:PD40 domain-containing protein [Flavobacteriales bacterium]